MKIHDMDRLSQEGLRPSLSIPELHTASAKQSQNHSSYYKV